VRRGTTVGEYECNLSGGGDGKVESEQPCAEGDQLRRTCVQIDPRDETFSKVASGVAQ
jgi:hypothetical protein